MQDAARCGTPAVVELGLQSHSHQPCTLYEMHSHLRDRTLRDYHVGARRHDLLDHLQGKACSPVRVWLSMVGMGGGVGVGVWGQGRAGQGGMQGTGMDRYSRIAFSMAFSSDTL